MKYGPIICDPRSEEAKALVGKKVIACSIYVQIDDEPYYSTPHVLDEIVGGTDPFKVNGHKWPFIREVIEEGPVYRPYESMTDMVEDYKERLGIEAPSYTIPSIWLKPKCGAESAYPIDGYDTDNGFEVYVAGWWADPNKLLDKYTYLDGSPVGKEVSDGTED